MQLRVRPIPRNKIVYRGCECEDGSDDNTGQCNPSFGVQLSSGLSRCCTDTEYSKSRSSNGRENFCGKTESRCCNQFCKADVKNRRHGEHNNERDNPGHTTRFWRGFELRQFADQLRQRGARPMLFLMEHFLR